MSKQMYEVEDTNGEKWRIYRGDPAYRILDALHRRGWVVSLPPVCLATGTITEAHVLRAESEHVDLAAACGTEDEGLDGQLLATHDTAKALAWLLGEQEAGHL